MKSFALLHISFVTKLFFHTANSLLLPVCLPFHYHEFLHVHSHDSRKWNILYFYNNIFIDYVRARAHTLKFYLFKNLKYTKKLLTQTIVKFSSSFSISNSSILFITGLSPTVFQFLLFHIGIHFVMQEMRNLESVLIFNFLIPAFFACLAATVTAWISAILLVGRPFTGSDTFLW